MSTSASAFVGSVPENYDRHLGPNIFVDYGERLASRVAQLAPKNVLELAAGTGIVSRKLRDRLPARAALTVTDLNEPMLEIAKAKFTEGEAVSFQAANALDLPFEDGAFDAIACQFGVMFFPDKPGSFREAARVLRPGGHYVLNTWGPQEANPFSAITQSLAERFFPEDPPGFYKVPFSYPGPEAVFADFQAAGWTEISHETLRIEKPIADLDGFARGIVYGNPFAEEIRARGGTDPDEMARAVADAFRERFGATDPVMPLEANMYVARKQA